MRQAIYTYLTTSNDFITLLGSKLDYKRPLNDKDFPYCVYDITNGERSIDSHDKFPQLKLEFKIYDGSNDADEESTISSNKIEQLAYELDKMLDNKQNSITISNYHLVRIKQNNTIELPTSSNAVLGIRIVYDVTLQITR